MNALDELHQRFAQWGRAHLCRQTQGTRTFLRNAHSCWMPKGNLYTEHDIGNKLVRYPSGKRRAVGVTKVRDTGGRTFLSFDADTPLS